MTEPASRATQARGFISGSEYHRPRIWRSAILVLLGVPLLVLGLYLMVNDLPEMSVRKAEIWFSAGPLMLGVVGLAFGAYGLATGIRGAIRTGDNAIDLELSKDGVTVRGGHAIPSESIKGATAVQYINDSKARLLWRRSDLNHALVLRVKDPLDVPGARRRTAGTRFGSSCCATPPPSTRSPSQKPSRSSDRGGSRWWRPRSTSRPDHPRHELLLSA